MNEKKNLPHLEFYFILSIFIFVNMFNSRSYSQVSDYISNVEISNAKEGEPLVINANITQPSAISKIDFVYRAFGQSEFNVQEMSLVGANASTSVSAEGIHPPYVEYFFRIFLNNGKSEVYPIGAPKSAAALRVDIKPVSEKDKQIIILSPQKGEITNLSDLLITVSLLRLPTTVDKKATKIFIDGRDVTSLVLFSDDLLILRPDNLEIPIKKRNHLLKINIYKKDGKLYHSVTTQFGVIVDAGSSAYENRFIYGMDIDAESRNERFNGIDTWYNNVALNVNGTYNDWKFKGRAYVTSEEEATRQAQNRFYARISNSWLNLVVGDNFPSYSNLIMDGKRVRGVTGSVKYGAFNLQSSFGQIRRSIEGKLIIKLFKDPLESDVIRIDSVKYGAPFGRVKFGTYNRNVFAINTYAEGSHYKFGLSYLHSKDDNSSIVFGGKPEENAVFGTNLNLKFDQRRIQFSGQAAVSVFNTDISTGELSDAQIDSLFGNGSFSSISVSDAKKLKSIVSPFITFNQFLGPLNPEKFSTLAWESALRLSYFKNNIKATYIYRGNDYRSFGQSYLRTDIKGYNVIDRINLLSNKLFVSVGYENLEDNLQNTKPATTVFQTINSAISIYPRNGLPNFTIGFSHYDNNNSMPKDSSEINNITNNISASVSYDFTAGVRHSARLSFSSSVRDDRSLFNSDANIKLGVLNFKSTWNIHFASILNTVYSSSEVGGISYSYVTVNAGGRFNFFENRLRFTATVGPSFGDLERMAIDVYGNYQLLENIRLGFQARYYKLKNQSYSSIFSLTAQVSL